MDDRRIDLFVKGLAAGHNRRSLLKGLLGLGGLTATGAVLFGDADAARRGYSGPPTVAPQPTPLPTQAPIDAPESTQTQLPTASCDGVSCNDLCCNGACTASGDCCPVGNTVCGAECCPNDRATCCDGACCFGVCYGEELCCPVAAMCGQTCCGPAEHCCGLNSEQPMCIPGDGCCSDDDCAQGACIDHRCEFGPLSEPPTVSLAIDSDCLAQLTLTNFPPGIDLAAIQLLGKTSPSAPPIELERMSNIPIPFLGSLTLTFGSDLSGFVEIQANVNTGSHDYPTNPIPMTCFRPTPIPTATATPPLDPRVVLTVGDDCDLRVELTGFGAGTNVSIAIIGQNNQYLIPIEIPIMRIASATIDSGGSLVLPAVVPGAIRAYIDRVQVRVSFERNRYESVWIPIDCQ